MPELSYPEYREWIKRFTLAGAALAGSIADTDIDATAEREANTLEIYTDDGLEMTISDEERAEFAQVFARATRHPESSLVY